MTIILNIHDQRVTDMATFLNSDLYTAHAHVTASEFGITQAEMPIYLDIFNDHMARRFTASEAIRCAIEGVIGNYTLTTELIKQHNQKP